MLFRFKLATFALLLAAGSGLTAPARAQGPPPTDAVSYQTFYDALSPYGVWVDDPDYGYAWVPSAGPDFQPYRTNGHWVFTDYGWTWVSDYQWGWAPFHYGRWRYSDGYGWLWVPGYTWGPAWVAWRQSQGYYGWAPLGPPPVRSGVRVNIGFSFSFGDAPEAPARWCFVPAAYVASPRIATYYVPLTQTTVVYNNTTVIHNTYVNNSVHVNNSSTVVNNDNRTAVNTPGHRDDRLNASAPAGSAGQPAYPAGPSRAEVEKATGQPIKPLAVTSRPTPGAGLQGQSLALYRPQVAAPPRPERENKAGAAAPAPAPQKVVPLTEAASQSRNASNANRGLMHNNAVQHLNSTDPDPIQGARARQAAERQSQANASSPGLHDEPGLNSHVPDRENPARPASATNPPTGTNQSNPDAQRGRPARPNGAAGNNPNNGAAPSSAPPAAPPLPGPADVRPTNGSNRSGNQPPRAAPNPVPTDAPATQNRAPKPSRPAPNLAPANTPPANRPQQRMASPQPAAASTNPPAPRPQPANRPANQPRPAAAPRPAAPHPGGEEREHH